MRIKALYAGKTFTFTRKEIVEYAIVSEKDTDDADVAILSKEPTDGVKRFTDPVKGWLNMPSWEVREKLLIINGVPRRILGTGILRLDDVKVEKAIPVSKIVEAVLAKGSELSKALTEGKETIEGGEDKLVLDGLEIALTRVTPPGTTDELVATLSNLHSYVTVPRRRVFLAAPVFVEITHGSGTNWYVVTLPRALQFMRDNPETVVLAGVIDEGGFKTPFFVVKGMTITDLGDFESQRSSVDFLDRILRISGGVMFATGLGAGIGGGGGTARGTF